MVNEATRPGWRLVHDGHVVIMLAYSVGVTTTIHTIFEGADKSACDSEIVRLGLVPLPVNDVPVDN